jgi:hypothetical protein
MAKSRHTRRILYLPLTKWQAAVDKLSHAERLDVQNDIDAVCEQSARLAGYIRARADATGGDQGHDKAVKNSTVMNRRVRKALGYLVPNNPVTF